uniref:protein-tyrosine-phosphatase n=1 Tax=Diabrotica virgifera virgifera TaxID=50390 RepID=A0A6P7GN49_DIAVI
MIESVSKRAFGGSSGTYNVHALELAAARERKLKTLSITVKFLDDTEHVFHVEKRAKGATLLDQVYRHLELVEKDYFGLQYSDNGGLPGTRGSVWMHWLDPSKTLKKQLGTCQYILHFRVKFYVSDPSKLQEEYTRYQFYLQLRRDILDGKLYLPPSTAILLASYTVQSELGDYQPDEHGPNYLSNIHLVPNQNEDIEKKISELHKLHNFMLLLQNSESYDTLLGFNMETYRSSKTLWKSCVEHHTFFRLHSPRVRRKFPLSLGSKFTYSGRTEYQTVTEVRQRGILERKFVRSPSKYLGSQPVQTPPLEDRGKIVTAPARPPGPYAHKVTSLDTKEPKKAWTEDSRISDDDGGFLERTLEGPFSPGIAGRVISYADEEPPSPTSNGLYDTPPYSLSHSPTSQIIDDNLVNIVLHPDEEGKYGFNVKGGNERNVPILVSRVAPNTPADKCVPRLSEGDQVLQINGHDVSHALHQDVVKLIQDARSANSGKLVLVVKPNVLYQGYEDFEEPPYQYVPAGENEPSSPGNALQQSMLLLADGLASGALIARYETLFRKHPDLTCDESLKQPNVNKNRYRDILPYDSTRVVLKIGSNGDYINANYVNMSISGTETINRYIATQGPLPATTEDFWQMILEEECNLIVMLTTIIERGRAKCHKYWPGLGEALTMQNIIVKCVGEETDPSGSFVFRDFVLLDIKNNESRDIKHMQYIAWPDHGVPDSPQQFLYFTEKVRAARKGSSPVVVHCSAGIGRTGVMVLMETALCLMEVSEPVYPLEIVKTMREQRAMMIQNASQYRFVCESVHAAYSDKINVPKSES